MSAYLGLHRMSLSYRILRLEKSNLNFREKDCKERIRQMRKAKNVVDDFKNTTNNLSEFTDSILNLMMGIDLV
jgi:hypothetical protein